MSLNWNQRPLNGCLFESTPVAAPMVGASNSLNLPALVDLREHCSVVEDQRTTNSCTANAIVGALEYHQRKLGRPVTDLSRMFVYYNARQLSGHEDKDDGSHIHHVMAAVLAHGACEERMWPFQEAMCLTKPTDAAYKNAQNYQAVQYGRTPLGVSALATVAAGLPVVFGTYLPGHYLHGDAAKTGVMPEPGEQREPQGSGHAMLIVGYDAAAEHWIVRNSWGTKWADDGYVRIPFATLKAYSHPNHFWTIGSIEQTAGLSLSQPQLADQAPAIGTIPVPDAAERADMRAGLRERLTSDLESAKSDFRNRLRGPRELSRCPPPASCRAHRAACARPGAHGHCDWGSPASCWGSPRPRSGTWARTPRACGAGSGKSCATPA